MAVLELVEKLPLTSTQVIFFISVIIFQVLIHHSLWVHCYYFTQVMRFTYPILRKSTLTYRESNTTIFTALWKTQITKISWQLKWGNLSLSVGFIWKKRTVSIAQLHLSVQVQYIHFKTSVTTPHLFGVSPTWLPRLGVDLGLCCFLFSS